MSLRKSDWRIVPIAPTIQGTKWGKTQGSEREHQLSRQRAAYGGEIGTPFPRFVWDPFFRTQSPNPKQCNLSNQRTRALLPLRERMPAANYDFVIVGGKPARRAQ
jgi:hypothetical protein